MALALRRLVTSLATLAGLLAAPLALAGPYSSLTVFGDSLSDTGNIFLATGGAVPAAPYFNGRFSDGPVWIDHLAAGLGLASGAVPSVAGGSNYSFGGARTGAAAAPIPGILAQIGGLWAPTHPLADPTGLYLVVGGGNDMRDARGAASTDATRQAAADAAALNIFNGVAALAARGAQHVVISTLPDLGATPEAVGLGLVAQSTDAANRYNAAVALLEGQLEALFGLLDVILFDMAGIAADIRDDALNNGGAEFGITNVLTPCGPFPGSIGIACNVSAFSDALHPSAVTHALFGAALLARVPLPASVLLLALGLLCLTVRQRRATS